MRPSHTEGTSWDGWGGSGDDDTGIEWEYLHSGFGIARTPGGKWYEYPQREFEFYDDPVDDATGKVEVKLDSNWGKNGRVKIRQLDPLPLSVLAVIPRLTVGGF